MSPARPAHRGGDRRRRLRPDRGARVNRTHQVTVFEGDTRVGGHAHTHDVPAADGRALRIDSGFIVHNERTYPHLLRLFRELDVPTQATEMSMSITCDACGLSYAGGRGLRGLLAQPSRLSDPRFLRMLAEVPRFHRAARALLDSAGADRPDLGRVPRRGQVLRLLRAALRPPAGLLRVVLGRPRLGRLPRPPPVPLPRPPRDAHGDGSPSWRTVTGGSATYVDRLVARLPDVRRGTAVTSVVRHDDGVEVRTAAGEVTTYDRVVIATHADQALDLLADATPEEKQDLGAIRYSVNETWLHRDSSVLPERMERTLVMELPDALRHPRGRGPGQLLDEPAARTRRHGRPRGHPQRRGAGRPGHRHREDDLRAPGLHPRRGRRGRPVAHRRRRRGSPSRAPISAGGSTRTAAVPGSRQRSRSGCAGDHGPHSPAPGAGGRHGQPRPPHSPAPRVRAPTVPVAGRPRRAPAAPVARAAAGPVRPARSPGPGSARGRHPRRRRAVPRPPRHPDGRRRPGAHAGQRPGARPHLRPAVGVLVPGP